MTAAAGLGLGRLELEVDGRALVPGDAPGVRADRAVRETFGVRDPIAVVIRGEGSGSVFEPAILRRLRDVTAAIAALPGVEPAYLASLATEKGLRHRPGSLDFYTLLEPLPETAADIERLRDELRQIGLYDGTLVSFDGRAAAILVGTPPDADRRAFVRRLRSAAGPDAEVVGAPVAEALLGEHVLADLGVPAAWLDGGGRRLPLAPLAVAVMGLVFLAAFRRPAAALLPLLEAGCALVIVLGVMGWLGVPVTLVTTVLPVILTAVGVADEIHVFRRYRDLAAERPELGPVERTRAALDEMATPVTRTSVTTAVGFLSFALSPIAPVRDFGLLAAFGVLVCMVFTLYAVPALLVVVPERWWLGRAPGSGRPGRIFERLAALGKRRRALAAGALAAGIAAGLGIARIEVQDSWQGGFDPASELARASRRFDANFYGSHLLQVRLAARAARFSGRVDGGDVSDLRLRLPPSVDASPDELAGCGLRAFKLGPVVRGQVPEWRTWIESAALEDSRLVLTVPRRGGLLAFVLRPRPGESLGFEVDCRPFVIPAVLRRLADFETFLGSREGVGGVLGPARFLETAGFMVRPDDPSSRRIPDEPREIQALWRHYGRVRGTERLRQLIADDDAQALVTAYLEDADHARTARLMEEVRDYAREHLEPRGLEIAFAGDVAVSQALIDAVVATQVRSLLWALAGIAAVAAIFGRSLRWGLLCALAPASAVALCFGAMGWLGIPLGVATSMFAGMTLGVGVDYAVHLLSRLERTGSLREALRTTGPAIAIDAAAVGLGFSLLTLSAVPANARLGALLALAVAGCLAATLLLVPALAERRA